MLKKICVYTCITDLYNTLDEIDREDGIEYICFTNNKGIHLKNWKIIYIENKEVDNPLLIEKIKILGHQYIRENYDISIWIDKKILVKGNLKQFIAAQCNLDKYDMVCFANIMKDWTYPGELTVAEVIKHSDFVKQEKNPRNNELCKRGILVRKTRKPLIEKAMEMWFDMLQKHDELDQLSFCVYKAGLNVQLINEDIYNNQYFGVMPHIQVSKPDTIQVFLGNFTELTGGLFDKLEIANSGNDHYKIIVQSEGEHNYIDIYFPILQGYKLYNTTIENGKNYYIEYQNMGLEINNQYYLDQYPLHMKIHKKILKGDNISVSFDAKKIGFDDWMRAVEVLTDNHNKENTMLKQRISDLYIELNDKNAFINAVSNSTSWRYLEKIRKIKRKLKI